MSSNGTTLTAAQRANFKVTLERTMEGARHMLRALGFAADAGTERASGNCPHCGKALDAEPDEPKDDAAKDGPKDEPAADQAKTAAAEAFGWGRAIARDNACQTRGPAQASCTLTQTPTELRRGAQPRRQNQREP